MEITLVEPGEPARRIRKSAVLAGLPEPNARAVPWSAYELDTGSLEGLTEVNQRAAPAWRDAIMGLEALNCLSGETRPLGCLFSGPTQ